MDDAQAVAAESRKFMKSLPGQIEGVKKGLTQGFTAAATVPALATMGTGFLQNMAANKRNQQLLSAIGRIGKKPMPQQAFRLHHGQNKTRKAYGY
jgi:hypothetical protein